MLHKINSVTNRMSRSLPLNKDSGCPDGYHKRNSYTTSAGYRVGPRCVRSTTVYKNTSKEFKRKENAKKTHRAKLYIPSIKSLSRKACPPGMIERKGFVRRYSSEVRQKGFSVHRNGKTYRIFPKERSISINSRCVKNTGKLSNGITRSIGPLRKGELAKHGYAFRKSDMARHRALKHAVDDFGPLGVYRKLDAVAKLTVKKLPEASKTYAQDRNWIKEKFGPLKAPNLV